MHREMMLMLMLAFVQTWISCEYHFLRSTRGAFSWAAKSKWNTSLLLAVRLSDEPFERVEAVAAEFGVMGTGLSVWPRSSKV